jgi:hypothetical protein
MTSLVVCMSLRSLVAARLSLRHCGRVLSSPLPNRIKHARSAANVRVSVILGNLPR